MKGAETNSQSTSFLNNKLKKMGIYAAQPTLCATKYAAVARQSA